MNPCISNGFTTNLHLYTETQHWHWAQGAFVGTCSLSVNIISTLTVLCCHRRRPVWLQQMQQHHKTWTWRIWRTMQRCKQQTLGTGWSGSSSSPQCSASVHTYRLLQQQQQQHQWRSIKDVNILTLWMTLNTVLATQCAHHEICWTVEQRSRDQRTYLEKLLVVHVLIAINVEHFESYVESCVRLCNTKAMSVASKLVQCNITSPAAYEKWLWTNSKILCCDVKNCSIGTFRGATINFQPYY